MTTKTASKTRRMNPLRAIEANRLDELAGKADRTLKKELEQAAGAVRRTGRKPFPEARRRKNPISIRFTDGELEFLRMVAEDQGRELAELIHELVMGAAEARFV